MAMAAMNGGAARAQASLPAPVVLGSGWQLQDAAKVTALPGKVASAEFATENGHVAGWHTAVVPGTVLTSLVKDGTYPDPMYGENNRPDVISESLAHTNYWYRTNFTVPQAYAGHHIWLNFDGVNYAAAMWVNGKQVGSTLGAFARGAFDISALVQPGSTAVLAVLVSPQPHPGVSHEHTLRDGMGLNGGMTALDGPTFLSTIGWDWIPAIRDRDTGIWQKVFLSASGPVQVKNPLVTTDLPLPRLDSANIAVKTTVENITDQPQHGVLRGSFGAVHFAREIDLAPKSSKLVSFTPVTTPALHVLHPKLWWPNGYGPQNLYTLRLSFEVGGEVSDRHDTSFGVRKMSYSVSDSENLTISVNGVRVFVRGGDWGLDDAMKQIPRERLEAQIRMHQIAHLNMIRNWVGQSTNEDFYELCDKYGLMLWDEFFQPNPSDGPNPMDLDLYIANVREKILRFRNHPSIAVWCARNEGYPPKEIDDALRKLMGELEPTRLYQPSSTDGRGVHSGGPYYWRTPREYYSYPDSEAFKTEIGSVSIPTLESIQGMMPQKDWESINDDWAEHDLAKGAQHGDTYPTVLAERYGRFANLADFVRKAQLANYEAFRAMYEGRSAKLFHPATGVITWMSHPAQPSFVWQLYHHDLEPNASLFAVCKAGEMVHIQLNESNGQLEVINNRPEVLDGATAHVALYNLDGSIAYEHSAPVHAAASAETDLGVVAWPAGLSPVHFVKLELRDGGGTLLSDNFYWRALPQQQDDLQALNQLAPITLEAKAVRSQANGTVLLTVTLHNPGKKVALMTHLQLRRKGSGERVLPAFYSDNYVSLVPNETRTITIEAAVADLKGDTPLVAVDGWNIAGASFAGPDVAVALNENAQVAHWPATGLSIADTAAQ